MCQRRFFFFLLYCLKEANVVNKNKIFRIWMIVFDFGKSMQPFNIFYSTFADICISIRYIPSLRQRADSTSQSFNVAPFQKRSSPKRAWNTGPFEASSTFAGSGEPREWLGGGAGAVFFPVQFLSDAPEFIQPRSRCKFPGNNNQVLGGGNSNTFCFHPETFGEDFHPFLTSIC